MAKKKHFVSQEELVRQNEQRYGAEARANYGDAAVDASNARLMGLTAEEYAAWQALAERIQSELEAAVRAGEAPDGPVGQGIAKLHRDWLGYVMPDYIPARHAGIAELYIQDERFTAHYDAALPGCAQFLRDAVVSYTASL